MKIRISLIVGALLLSGALWTMPQGHSVAAAPPTVASPDAVIQWNSIAQRVAITVAKEFQVQSEIYLSFAHAAVHDAVVVIQGGYQPYQLALTPHPVGRREGKEVRPVIKTLS
jgi:hypothetical protein